MPRHDHGDAIERDGFAPAGLRQPGGGDDYSYQGYPYPRGLGRIPRDSDRLPPSPEVQAMNALDGARVAAPAALAGAGIVLVAMWALFMMLAVLAVTSVVSWPTPSPTQACVESDARTADRAAELRANPRAGGISQPCR